MIAQPDISTTVIDFNHAHIAYADNAVDSRVSTAVAIDHCVITHGKGGSYFITPKGFSRCATR